MKKGLLLTLVIAVALISSSVFAYAPVLKNLPDIIIGDVEEGASNNFFIFSDAFVFDNFVTDQDTTVSTHIKWSFSNMTGTQTIFINGLDEETVDAEFKNPTNDIRDGYLTASFRNETASPTSGSTPFPPTVLADQELAVYVSDGAHVVSDKIMVYTIDDAEDGLSGLGEDPFWSDSFDTQGRWNAYSGATINPAPSSIASYDSVNKRLTLKFPVFPLPQPDYFPWLESAIPPAVGVNPVVTYAANTVYILKATISSDANDTVPAVRLRAQALDNIWTSCMMTGATGDQTGQVGAPTTTGEEFQMVFQPQGTTADAFIAVDAFSALSYTGEVYVEDLNLYAIDLTAPNASLASILTISDFTPWTVIGTGASKTAAAITIPDAFTGGADNFSQAGAFVKLPSDVQPGDYYRLRYSVSKNAVANWVDQVRLRVADTKNGGYNSNFVYNDNNASATLHFSTTPASVYMWHQALNTTSTTFNADLSVFFDLIDSTPGVVNATAILTGVEIEKATLPELN
jgi:hypothetical protein